MDRQTQLREKSTAAWTSVVAAVFLTALKIIVGLATGSLGILAEAAHSALDLGAALITLFAVRVSDRPADESHLYGHGKVENLSALAEAILLLVTCGWIVYEAIHRLVSAQIEVNPSLWAFLTMGISIVVDFSRSRVLERAARKYGSQALEADALHFRTDIWSSAVVLVGLALVWAGEHIGWKSVLVRADAVAALGVAIIVIFVSLQLGRRTVDALLDSAPRGIAERIAAATLAVEAVRRVIQKRVRGSGNQLFVELHVAVPRHLSFEESHAVTLEVEDAVRTVEPEADVVVYPVPVAEEEGVLDLIQAVAERGHFPVHNITTHQTQKGTWVDLDLEVPPDLSLERAHALATNLETGLRTELEAYLQRSPTGPHGVADVNIHIEPRAEELIPGADLASEVREHYVRRIDAIRAGIPHARECYDVDVQKLAGGVYLAFHLRVDPEMPITEVHGLTEELENRLRREMPELGRVVIHAEPYAADDARGRDGEGRVN